MPGLFDSVTIGENSLQTRVAMAPMTRGRARLEGNVPTDDMVSYYRQRAAGGASLIITEATFISPAAVGWYRAPGCWSNEQMEGWKRVVSAVHEEGSTISLQLWHMGRQGHSKLAGGIPTVSASAIKLDGEMHLSPEKKVPYETPRVASVEEIGEIVKDYRKAAKNANAAGFDFVEIHCANGYLVDQFMQSCTNQRTDEYGGSVQNRLRFMKEVVDAVLEELPAAKVGIRFSPNGNYGGMGSDDGTETFTEAIKFVASRNLAYLHLMDGLGFGFHQKYDAFTLAQTRAILQKGASGQSHVTLIGNVGYDKENASKQVEEGHADLIAFGRPFLNCPDFAKRIRSGSELPSDLPIQLWFAGDSHGYTDCPVEL